MIHVASDLWIVAVYLRIEPLEPANEEARSAGPSTSQAKLAS
jgi:hypothetical protein